MPYILRILKLILWLLSLKNAWLPTFLFLDSIAFAKICLFPHSHNICKNISELGPTVLKLCSCNALLGYFSYLELVLIRSHVEFKKSVYNNRGLDVEFSEY